MKLKDLLNESLIEDQELINLGLDPLRRILPRLGDKRSLPVKPIDNSQWTKLSSAEKQSLKREFNFSKYEVFKAFLDEVLQYEYDNEHNAHITIFDKTVTIEVWTEGVNEVTEIDIEYAREIDRFAEDVVYHFYSDPVE